MTDHFMVYYSDPFAQVLTVHESVSSCPHFVSQGLQHPVTEIASISGSVAY